MNRQTFDLGWEYTEATAFFAAAFPQWQLVNLPHDLSIHKARNQNYRTGSPGGYTWSGVVTYRKKTVLSSNLGYGPDDRGRSAAKLLCASSNRGSGCTGSPACQLQPKMLMN